MNLTQLTEELIRKTPNLFEEVEQQDVDWDFPDVTIITTAGNAQEAGQGGMTDDSAKTEVLDGDDQENQEGQESQGGEGQEGDGEGQEGQESGDSGGEGGGSQNEVKPGSIVQDMTSGEYGKVTKVNPDGSVEWEPVGEDELKEKGFLATRRDKGLVKKVTKFDRSDLRGFVG